MVPISRAHTPTLTPKIYKIDVLCILLRRSRLNKLGGVSGAFAIVSYLVARAIRNAIRANRFA